MHPQPASLRLPLLWFAPFLVLAACAEPASWATGGQPLTSVNSSADFGSVEIGTTSAAGQVTLTNDHHRKTIRIDSLSIPEPLAASGPSVPRTVGPGESVTFEVRFSPVAAGTYRETLTATIRRDSDFSLTFTGVGVDPGCVGCDADAGMPEPEPEPGLGVVVGRVSAASDDAEESAVSGAMYLDSSDLELTEDDHAGAPAQVVGIRLRVDIPRDATVYSAAVQFSVDEASEGPCELSIDVEAAGDAAPIGDGAGDLSHRALSGSPVSWAPPAWTEPGADGSAQRTPDLAALLQQLVDRPDWS